MALTVTNNIPSLFAQNSLNNTSNALNTSLQRLSSGLKINSGADGPAALVISQQQLAQIAGLQTAIANTSKATNLAQTAEGALGTINDLLTQIRGLALDSANSGVNDSNALAANQAELANALQTIDRIANTTQFGTKKLLDGSAGFNATSADTTSFASLRAASTTATGNYTITTTQNAQEGAVTVAGGATAGTGNLSNVNNLAAAETLTITGAGGTATINLAAGLTNTQVASAINSFTSQTGVVANVGGANGGLQLFSKQFGQNFTVVSSTAAANGQTGIGTTLVDTNSTASAGSLTITKGQNALVNITGPAGSGVNIVGQASNGDTVTVATGGATGLSFTLNPAAGNPLVTTAVAGSTVTVTNGTLVFQIGANAGQTASLAINKATSDAIGLNVAGVQFTSLKQVDVTTTQGAQDTIKVVDQAINDITNQRGTLGAFQANTLQSTANNLQITLNNTTAAESTIRDTDFASEIANFTKLQVQLQAGTTVLGIANQIPQNILALLQKA